MHIGVKRKYTVTRQRLFFSPGSRRGGEVVAIAKVIEVDKQYHRGRNVLQDKNT